MSTTDAITQAEEQFENGDVEGAFETLTDAVEDAYTRLDSQSRRIDNLRDELAEERKQREDLERQLHDREQTIEELRDKVSQIDSRTNLLEVVEQSDDLTAKQRSTVLIQSLYKNAKAQERRGRKPKASMDRDAAKEALHHPDVDRTTYYKDFQRAERLVGDDDLVWKDEGKLYINLEEGALQDRFTTNSEGERL